MSKEAYYAVARGRNVGIYSSWDMCKEQVTGFNNARYKKFSSISEAAAFVDSNKASSDSAPRTVNASSSSNCGSSNANVGSNPSKLSDKRGSSSSSLRTVGKRSYAASNNSCDNGGGDHELPAKRINISQSSSASRANCPIVYTDGACSSNGRNGAKAGWGVYWGDGHPDNSCGPVDGLATNNRGELQAVVKAIEKAKDSNVKEIVIRTDSQLCINSCDTWINKWERNGWKTATGDVKNKDLLVQIQNLRKKVDVHFEKVKAHCGEPGNEAADELARKGAELYKT